MRIKYCHLKLLEHFQKFPFSLLHIATNGKFGKGEIALAGIGLVATHNNSWEITMDDLINLHRSAYEINQDRQTILGKSREDSIRQMEHSVTPIWFPETKPTVDRPEISVLLILAEQNEQQLRLGLFALKMDGFIDWEESKITPRQKLFDTLFEGCRENGTML